MQFLICRQRKSWRLHFNPYLNICIFSGFLLVWCVAKTYRRKFRQQKPAFLLHEERWILNHFGFSFCFSYCTIKIKNVSNLPNSENAPVIKKKKKKKAQGRLCVQGGIRCIRATYHRGHVAPATLNVQPLFRDPGSMLTYISMPLSPPGNSNILLLLTIILNVILMGKLFKDRPLTTEVVAVYSLWGDHLQPTNRIVFVE